MAFPANLSERVVEAMREVANEIILPRFQHLATADVEEKSPGELVTIADKESERVLTMRLKDILPGSTVIGEELAEIQPEVVDRVGKGTVWLVDPLDGTSNFVAGKALFSVMVSLVVDGETQLGLMLNPVTGVLHHAELGAGAFRDGERLRAFDGALPLGELRGSILNRLLPPDLKADLAGRANGLKANLPGFGCAGVEYPAIVENDQHFALFWRSLPWDHAPGTLFVREAGGVARRLNGEEYRPEDRSKGLIIACNEAVYEEVCTKLIGRGAW